MKTPIHPLTLLYDGRCPVCSLEMDGLRAQDSHGRLRFEDISAPDFDAAPWGATAAQLDARLHAVARNRHGISRTVAPLIERIAAACAARRMQRCTDGACANAEKTRRPS